MTDEEGLSDEAPNEHRPEQPLTPLSEILSRGLGRPDGRSEPSQNRTRPRETKKTEQCTCASCGKTFEGEVITYRFFEPPREVRARECPECKAAREAEECRQEERETQLLMARVRERWCRECGVPWDLNATRFEDLDPVYAPRVQKACRRWAEGFSCDRPGDSPSLLLYSKVPGVGKTTLLACIADYIISHWAGDPTAAVSPIRFHSGPGLVRRIRATWNLPDDAPRHEREEDVYKELRGVKLLMLDDVGKEQPRSYRFTREMYWYIIDERVKARLPLILNSRLPMTGEDSLEDLMGKDTVDRLYGMCRGEMFEIEAPSYRRLKRIA